MWHLHKNRWSPVPPGHQQLKVRILPQRHQQKRCFHPPAPNINMFYQSIFTNACGCEAGVHPMVFVKTLCLNPICLFVALFPIWASWQFFHTNHRLTPLVQRLHWNARLHLTFWQRSWFDQKIGGRNSPWQPRTLIFRGYIAQTCWEWKPAFFNGFGVQG